VSQRREEQRGFALLVIFLMAAAIALMLYVQMPRVAFETEREKERLLIDRGEQYKRAIQLYYTAFQRYPTRIEDLESTNDKRFLRRRYVNPYTGKDDWRLIHINGGVLTDSLVQKPNPAGNGNAQAGGGQLAGASSSPTGTATTASTTTATNVNPNAPVAVNQAVLQRPSDRTLPTNNSFNQTAAANPFPNAAPGQAPFNQPGFSQPGFNQPGFNQAGFNDPSSYPPISLYPNGYNAPPVTQQQGVNQQPGLNQQGFNQPGLNQPGLNQPGLNQPGLNQPGFNQPGFNPQGNNAPPNQAGVLPPLMPGQQAPNSQQNNGQQLTGQSAPGGLQVPAGINPNFANQFPTNPDPNSFNTPGQQPVPQPFLPAGGIAPTPGGNTLNPAATMIQNLLTTPRQPPPGIGTTASQPTTSGPAGLAGIASTYTGPSIMSYGNRTQFEEWEFVFQPGNQQGVSGVAPQGNNQNGGLPGQPPTAGNSPNGVVPPPLFPPAK
jgi:type II secretory pathway pseudopilin PulG